jgi:hypothetical protein
MRVCSLNSVTVILLIGRFTEIEKANRILLERMTSIMQNPNKQTTVTPQSK